jgi:hypothetical protein
MPTPSRTLLPLLRKIASQRKELLANPRAYTWGWVSARIHATLEKRQFKYAKRLYPTAHFWDLGPQATAEIQALAQADLDEVCTKVLGTPMQAVVNSITDFWPKDNCKGFWDGADLVYVPNYRWDELRVAKFIRWCSDINDWTTSDHFVTTWYLDKAGHAQSKVISMAKGNLKKNQPCPSCNKTWKKAFIQPSAKTDQLCCPLCVQKVKPNPPLSTDTVWGNYHSHGRGQTPWIHQIQRTGKGDHKHLPMGVEVEMNMRKAPGSSDDALIFLNRNQQTTAWKIYKEQLRLNPKWNNLYFEADGSLGNGGMEMITNPMTLDFHHEYWKELMPFIRTQCVGWKTKQHNGGGTEPYGIHITFKKQYWGDYRLARFIKFVENPGQPAIHVRHRPAHADVRRLHPGHQWRQPADQTPGGDSREEALQLEPQPAGAHQGTGHRSR